MIWFSNLQFRISGIIKMVYQVDLYVMDITQLISGQKALYSGTAQSDPKVIFNVIVSNAVAL